MCNSRHKKLSASSKADFLASHYAGKVYRNAGNCALLQLIPRTAKTVLDVGCGAGDNAQQLKVRGCKVTGLTVSKAEADAAGPFCEKVIVGDVEGDISFLGNQQFDVILLSHLLEHLIRPERVLAQLATLLSKNGRIYVAVPNMAFWRVRIKLMKGDWTRTDTGPFDRTHLHFWSFRTAEHLAARAGLQLDSHLPGDLACPLWPLRIINPRYAKKIDAAVGQFFPNIFAMQTLLIIKSKLCAS